MNAKKVMPLVAAVVLGLLAAWEVQHIAQGQKGNGGDKNLNMAKVVVAKQDVPAGQELTSDDLTIGELATGTAASPNAYRDPVDLIGRVPTIPLIAGQAVTESLLAPKGSGSGLQALIPKGMRAITVEVDEFSSVAFYLTPGCHVDILHSMHDNSGESITKTIVQNVLITAVGTRPDPNANTPAAVKSVTLLVTPHQAELVALASATGRPRFILRNSNDTISADDASGVTMTELMGSPKNEAPTPVIYPSTQPASGTDAFGNGKPAPEFLTIRVITGGTPSTVSVKLPAATDTDTANTPTPPALPQ
jgi:pilus assembly protein CpaB